MSTARTPLSSIQTGYSFAGDTINVFFGPSGFRAPEDQAIVPGVLTTPVSEGFNDYEKAQFGTAFGIIEQYVDLSFEIVESSRDADFSLVLDTDQFTGNTLGYFYMPTGLAQYGVFNGDGWNRSAGGDLEVGGLGFVTIVHELLHGLGLDHPHDGEHSDMMEGVSKASGDYGTAGLNQGLYTMMSYNDGYGAGPVGTEAPTHARYGNQAGPMALDIAVLQSIYGANKHTNAGDSEYTLDGSNDTGTHWSAIWDVGGTDAIVFAGGRDAVIDLRAATLGYEAGGGGFVSAAANIAGGFTIAAGVEIENASGGGGDDVLRGNHLVNALTGGSGDDTLTGGGGTDRAVFADASSDLSVSKIAGGWRVVTANEGTDDLFGIELIAARDGEFAPLDLASTGLAGVDISGTRGSDRMIGTAASEQLKGLAGDDRIDGGEGRDTIDGGIGFDILSGGEDDDRLLGGNGFDTLSGDAGADRLEGAYGNDVLFGDGENDYLNGGLGFDRMEGGAGHDGLDGLDGYDTLIGGNGDDLLNGNAGNDRLLGDGGADRLNGGIGADTLNGGIDNDNLTGGNGADLLEGGAGADALSGNAGADRLDGGAGDDRLFGGIGSDAFVFKVGSGQDTVMDLGTVDRISLDASLVGNTPLGSFKSAVGNDLALDFGGGDVLVLFGYDDVGQIAGQIEFV